MNVIEYLYNWYHIKMFGLPSRRVMQIAYTHAIKQTSLLEQVYSSKPGVKPYNFNKAGMRKYQITYLYAFEGKSVEQLAKQHECTRTRVEGILYSVYYNYKNRFKTS